MNYLIILFAISMSLVLVSGQFFGGPAFGSFGRFTGQRSNGLRSVAPDFGGPSVYSGSYGSSSVRDPRQNRGPVVFPPGPPDAIEESSGVIVGASGYGFVPPSQSSSTLDSQFYPSFSFY